MIARPARVRPAPTRHPGHPGHPARVLVPAQARLGECVLWDERRQALLWCDIDNAKISRWVAADGSVQHWQLPVASLGSFALCEAPELLLLGLDSGVALFDLASGCLGPVTPVDTQDGALRINDGRCDPQGRFIFGMFTQQPDSAAAGHFWRVDAGLRLERLALPAARIANSLAFSPDGDLLYSADSARREILVCAYGADGSLGPTRRFAQLADSDGEPDGATVDAGGRLWVALWGAGCIVQFDGVGRERQRLPVPALHPTCPAFGGPHLNQLFVSTARKALDGAGLLQHPHAGDVFSLATAQRGLPERRFVTPLRPAA